MQVEGQRAEASATVAATGEWVSNTYPTCPSLGDSPPKGELTPHDCILGIFYALKVTVADGDASD